MTGRILRGAVGALLLLLATAAAPHQAHATSFAELTLEQFTDASTWIVEGKITRVWTELQADRGLVWTRAEVQISEVHKGPSVPETLVIDSLGGQYGDLIVHVPGRAVYAEGEPVFLFLDQLGSGRLVPVGKFSGKLTIRRAPGEREQFAMAWQAGQFERYDHRFLPVPPPERRIYLSDLRQRVQARLDAGWDGRPIPGMSPERLRAINVLERRIPR